MPYKLLLADDSLTIQKVVELVLAPENFEIRAYNDGEQALQALGSFVPDIVLADIEMPKLNGYQLCEKIKNDMATGHIPVILLAGAFEPFDEEYAKAVYADDFIIKPFESQELISKVKALLASLAPQKETKSSQPTAEAVEEPGAAEPSFVGESSMDLLLDGAASEAPNNVSVAPVGFEDELSMALKEDAAGKGEAPEEQFSFPSESEMPVAQEQGLDKPGFSGDMQASISSAKDISEKAISDLAPGIIENVTRELVKDLLGSLRNEIDGAIKRIVPEVAEAIIRKEIEKITSDLK